MGQAPRRTRPRRTPTTWLGVTGVLGGLGTVDLALAAIVATFGAFAMFLGADDRIEELVRQGAASRRH